MKPKIVRKRWGKEELDLLTEISEKRRILRNEVHRFNDRTYEALKCQCNRMGIPVHREGTWTSEDEDILRSIYASESSIKASMKLLPNHSYVSIKFRARKLGLVGSKAPSTDGSLSVVRASIIALLSRGQAFGTDEIAKRLGYCRDSIRNALRRGHGKDFYIAGWIRVGLHGSAPTWMVGCKQDAPRPPRKDTALCRREWKKRKKLKAGDFNPWSICAAPPAHKGPSRVFKQDMTIHLHDDFKEMV